MAAADDAYFYTTVYNENDDTKTGVFVSAVSEAVTTDCEDLMEVSQNGVSYYIYPNIEKAIKHSVIGKLLKDYGYTISQKADDKNNWDKIVQIIITPSCKLNVADLVVINWLANVDKTGTQSDKGITTTGGKVISLEILNGVTFVIEDEKISLAGYSYQNFPLKDNTITETFLRTGAFAYTSLERVILPSSITKIGAFGFIGTQLKSINLLHCKNLTDLGHQCFSDCDNMETAYLPENLTFTYGSLFWGNNSMKEVYITSKNELTDLDGGLNFVSMGSGTGTKIFIRIGLFDTYKQRGDEDEFSYIIPNWAYPLIEKGKEWRTFSFDKDLDFSTIKGLYNEENTLKAYYVSSFNPLTLSTEITEAGAFIANTGVLLYGEDGGAEEELYPIYGSDDASDPNYNPDTPSYIGNFLIAAVDGKNDIQQTENNRTNFLLYNGEFHLCDANGGSVDPYKAYLQLPASPSAFGFENNSPMLSIGLDNGNTSSIRKTEIDTAEKKNNVYTIQGVRMPANKTLPKGIYISNGKKFTVK